MQLEILNTVVGSLHGHKTHGVAVAGGGELAHGGPLVSLGIIKQHFCAAITTSCCNDKLLIVQTVDD